MAKKSTTEEVIELDPNTFMIEDGMYWTPFEIGEQYSDVWTGKSGLCVAITVMDTGCSRVMLELEPDDAPVGALLGSKNTDWYDPDRLITDGEEIAEWFGYPSEIILGEEYQHKHFPKIKGIATELYFYGAGKENNVRLKYYSKKYENIKDVLVDEGELIQVSTKAALAPTGTGAPVAAMYL